MSPTKNGAAPIPDATTVAQQARLAATRLSSLQEVRIELELTQIANDDEDTDGVEGLNPKTKPDGTVVIENGRPVWQTYGERRAELDAAEARIWKWIAGKGLTGLVEKMIAANKAQAEVEAETGGEA